MNSFLLIGICIGLLCGLFGIPLHNYEVEKCLHISENKYYEAQADCYMPLEKPNLNLFWAVLGFIVIGILVFGPIGFLIEDYKEGFI